jgi:CheY-like chemotaxis protein
MKHKVLFVDDDPQLLSGLNRSLRSHAADWDMVFVNNGRKAVDLAAQERFDVAVVDMRMPEMDGAATIAGIQKRSPRTIRLVLSGYADSDTIVRTSHIWHRYLSKPYEAAQLKTEMDGILALRGSFPTGELRDLVLQAGSLPVHPGLPLQMSVALEAQGGRRDGAGAIAVSDIGLAAQLLKLVNSAFFSFNRPTANPQAAVERLGLKLLNPILSGLSVWPEEPSAAGGLLTEFEKIGQRGIQTARAARAIALAEKADGQTADTAFGAGLLHEAGRILLIWHKPEEYAQMLKEARTAEVPLETVEEQTFGFPHAQLAAGLFALWGFPPVLVETIARQHAAPGGLDGGFCPLTALRAARAVTAKNEPTSRKSTSPDDDTDYLKNLGFADRIPGWRLAVINAEKLPAEAL